MFALAATTLALFAAGCGRVSDIVTAGSPAPTPTAASEEQPAPPAPAKPAAIAPVTRSLPSLDGISDAAITARITAGLASDPAMAGSDVSVNTDNGVVHLAGLVKSQEQVAIASAHAQGQDGVMRVDDHLSVTPR